MNTFQDREQRVFDFMNEVQNELKNKEQEDAFKNSTDYKLKTLNKCEDEAKGVCLDTIFAQIYRNAVPLNDDYKTSQADDLDASFKDFMNKRCPKGIEYYVHEGLKKNNPFAKKVLEAVQALVEDTYNDVAMNIEDHDVSELPFKKTDDINGKLNDICDKMSVPELSEVINNNVKQTAMAEISKAKEEKEKLKQFELDLAKDMSVRTEESVQTAMELAGLKDKRDYEPTLFESIMINKINDLRSKHGDVVSGVNLYGALSDYGYPANENTNISVEEMAFVESVKEYTAWSVLKALKLESMDKYKVHDLASQYATEKF